MNILISISTMAAVSVSLIAAGIPSFAASADGSPSMSTKSPFNTPIASIPTPIHAGTVGKLKTNKDSYRPGEPVLITFTVTNPTQRDVGYNFPTAKEFDITVTRASGGELWKLSRNMVYAQRLMYLGLKPGQSKTFTARWNGRDQSGRRITPGKYVVNAELTFEARLAIAGTVVASTDVDPQNMGMPTKTPSDTGVAREVNVTPPVTASKMIVVTTPPAKNPRY